jgi:hypothetical protein
MKNSRWIPSSLFLALSLISSCGSDGGNGEGPDSQPTPIPAPSATTLVFPANNSECNEGEVLNETQSRVLFQWNASQNTDTYQVNVRNLNTNRTSITNSTTNEAAIVLLRGVPYEWFVVSSANGTSETASSALWKFYNAGVGTTNYAPFPAIAQFPVRGSELAASGTISLQWEGADVDGDITGYDVFIDAGQEAPETLLASTSETSASFETDAGTTYTWKVVTKDASGNSTESELFNFKVAQ